MFGLVGGRQDLVVSSNRKSVEGTGVIVTDGAAQCRPRIWRLRIEEAAGVQLKSEWIQALHRHDLERRGFVPPSELFQHEHKMNMSACEGDADKLDELCDALAVAATPLAGSTVLPFTTTDGLCRPMWQSNGQVSALDLENWIESDSKKKASSTRASSQCSTRASTPLCQFRPDSPRASALQLPSPTSSCPSAIHCSNTYFSGASVSVGLISADQASFRGEVMVRGCYNNPCKIRGLGCAWRSDGLLLSQYLAADGTPITWSGHTAAFGVNDVPEIRFKPSASGGSARLLLNGKIVAGFPNDVLHWSPAWKLAVRVHRSRVTILSDIEEPAATRPCIPRPISARPARSIRRAILDQDSTALDRETGIAKREFESSEGLRKQLEILYRNKTLERCFPKEKPLPETYFPPTYIPGVGVKLVVGSPAEAARLEKSLQARVAANRARRLASPGIASCWE